MITIRWQALRGHPEAPFIVLDLVMLVLISINLAWLFFDAVFLDTGIGVLLQRHYPDMVAAYRANWHEDLLVADSVFTVVLVAELLFRWGVAMYRRTYHRWWFYPFVHWYDVLGCIPLPAFRALRLLRIVSIVYRLQSMGVIDLSRTSPFAVAQRYYRILLEELSDRIVSNVLDGVQREVRSGGPFTQRLTDDVLVPRRDVIVPWLAGLLSETAAHTHRRHRDALADYLRGRAGAAIAVNPEFQRLRRRVPVLGDAVEEELQAIVGSLLAQLAQDLLDDLGRPGNVAAHDIAGGLFDTVTTEHVPMGAAVREIVLDSLDLVKAQVMLQQWKAGEAGAVVR